MLETIRQRVQTAVNNSTQQIIVGVYQNMIASHNEFCGCNYCTVLKEYIKVKKFKSILNRELNNRNHDYFYRAGHWDPGEEEDMLCHIRKLGSKIKELKIYKDSLKVV